MLLAKRRSFRFREFVYQSARRVLTREYERGLVSAAPIADRERIPRKFLEAILLQARPAGLVDSQGKNGGYYLALPPASITIGSVIRAIDGPLVPLACVSGSAYRRCTEFVVEIRRETRLVMKQVHDAIVDVLDDVALSDLTKQSDETAGGATFEI